MDATFFERQQAAMQRVAVAQEDYDAAESAYQAAVTDRAATYEAVAEERRGRMHALEQKQAQEREALNAEMDGDYADTLAEADAALTAAVETVNAAQDNWRDVIATEVESKQITRPQIEMAGLVLPQRKHTHRKVA